MKSIIYLIIILIICFHSYSCSDNTTDDLISKYETVEIGSSAEYIADVDWLEPETEYSYSGENENIVSIYHGIYERQGDRIYMQTKSDGANTYNYISLTTGDQFNFCPDPLCPHTRDGGCQYLDIVDMLLSKTDENIVYIVKDYFDGETACNYICEIDLENNTIERIYGKKNSELFDAYNMRFINDNKIYFEVNRKHTIKDESQSLPDEYFYMELDLVTHEAREIKNEYTSGEYGSCIFASDDYFFFSDSDGTRLLATDKNFENSIIVYDFPGNYSLVSPYYDYETDEFYCVIYSNFMTKLSDDGVTEGYILRVDGDLNVERLDMRSDLILDMQLTRDYIYYTSYDPIEYGISPRGGVCYDESGGKIWRVPRDDVSAEPELVFDGHGEFAFRMGYYAVGDCLYLDYSEIVQENGTGYFRWHGINARVNFVDGTIKWLT